MGLARHVGPMAEDMKGLGLSDGQTVQPMDSAGLGLAAVKDLAKKVSRLEDVAGFGPREAHETTRGKSGTFGLGLTANDGGGVRLRLVASPRLSLGLGLAEAA